MGGFIQKARREDTLPTDPHDRMKCKYYIGDRDAAFEIDPNLMMKFDQLCTELGNDGINEFLTHLFFQWPTLPTKPEEVHRYGSHRKTWPIPPAAVKECIMSNPKYEEKMVNSVLDEMFENKGCECKKEDNFVCWPDVQCVFRVHLGDAAAGNVLMLDPKTTLTLKIPEAMIEDMLIGEWRMYCKSTANDGKDPAFSYGVMIDTVTVGPGTDNGHGTQMKKITFTGRPRQHGKYELKEGEATWNESGAGRLFLKYTEAWPNGTDDHLEARLKSNGKFACDSTAGFIQKARKETTLPSEAGERMKSKYYAGDTDAAHD